MALSLPRDLIKDDPELQWLNSTCLPIWETRSKQRHVARPERPEYAIALGLAPNAKWEGVLVQLREGMRRNESIRTTLKSAKATEQGASIHNDTAVGGKSSCISSWIAEYPHFFPVIATLLYAQESHRVLPEEKHTSTIPEYNAAAQENLKLGVKLRPQFKRLFFEMLHVDYGSSWMRVKPVEQGNCWVDFLRFTSSVISYANHFSQSWDDMDVTDVTVPDVVKEISSACDEFDPSDFAMILYYFHTHHRVLGSDKKVKYTCVMQALIDDIALLGNSERLHRKLSVDYNVLISQVDGPFSDTWAMKATARSYKEWHQLSLIIPTKKTLVEPYTEPKANYRQRWAKWMVIILLHNAFELMGERLLPSLMQKTWLWYTIVLVGFGFIKTSFDAIWDS
ncbi:uncharacterized protein PG986_004147 [Apiospora aurea]|uniref:Uncharacterized protein n=1 Tax=Apiospora aurea TaxID=335848 RepID=A0ABR1QLS0_9PEZI